MRYVRPFVGRARWIASYIFIQCASQRMAYVFASGWLIIIERSKCEETRDSEPISPQSHVTV